MSLPELQINHLALIILGARRADYQTGLAYGFGDVAAQAAAGNG
jgi:hypothetical protein